MTGADGRAENLDDFQNGVEAMSARQSRSSRPDRLAHAQASSSSYMMCVCVCVVYAVIVSGVTRRYVIIIIIIIIIIITSENS